MLTTGQRIKRAVVVAVLLMAACPVAARAATAAVSDSTLMYIATPGETNLVSISSNANGYLIEDLGVTNITEGANCTELDPHRTQCLSAGVLAVSFTLDDGNDELTITIADSAYPSGPLTGGSPIQAYGGAGDDVLTGGTGRDSLDGDAGKDRLSGGAGVDRVVGGSDDDIVDGGAGNDEFVAGSDGNDVVDGGPGDDGAVIGDAANDKVDGGPGIDYPSGGAGDDTVRGGDGDDHLDSRGSNAASGRDTLVGGAGNDVLAGGPAPGSAFSTGVGPPEADILSGGTGVDTADYASRIVSLNVTLDGIANDGQAGDGDDVEPDVERVIGGSDGDILVGSDGPNFLDGGRGDDQLDGLGGRDTLQGGVNDGGSDSLVGGAASDVLTGGAGDDSLDGGDDDDALFGEGGSDMLAGGGANDTLAGGPGIDSLEGGDGNDTLNGGDVGLVGADGGDDLNGGQGDDGLFGGPGNDRLDGGAGADRLNGEAGRDTVSYEDRVTPITVTFDDLANDGEQPGEKDNVARDVEIVVGGGEADTLTGDARGNRLEAGSGDDDVTGGDGLDRITGGAGIDLLRARDDSHDEVSCGDGVDLAIVDRLDTVSRDCDYVDRGGRQRPRLGRAAVARRGSRKVGLRLPGTRRPFASLPKRVKIPLGSTLDARKGAVHVVTAKTRGGAVQEASFRGGEFTVRQRRAARPVTEVRLVGGDFRSCRSSGGTRTSARTRLLTRGGKRKRKGRTWVRGDHSIGASYGTSWWTEDRCDGTLTRVLTGAVHVRDLGRHRTVVVTAGHRYLAKTK